MVSKWVISPTYKWSSPWGYNPLILTSNGTSKHIPFPTLPGPRLCLHLSISSLFASDIAPLRRSPGPGRHRPRWLKGLWKSNHHRSSPVSWKKTRRIRRYGESKVSRHGLPKEKGVHHNVSSSIELRIKQKNVRIWRVFCWKRSILVGIFSFWMLKASCFFPKRGCFFVQKFHLWICRPWARNGWTRDQKFVLSAGRMEETMVKLNSEQPNSIYHGNLRGPPQCHPPKK